MIKLMVKLPEKLVERMEVVANFRGFSSAQDWLSDFIQESTMVQQFIKEEVEEATGRYPED